MMIRNDNGKKILKIFFVSLCLCHFTAFAQAPADTRVIASGADWSITAQQFQQFLELLPDQQHQYFVDHRREFMDQLVRVWVMAADAKAHGLDKTPKFKATVDFYSNNMLAGELHRQQVSGNTTATDEAVKTFYETHIHDFTKARVSHIFVSKGTQARNKIDDVLARLRNGANFAELAKEYSDDQDSAGRGGDLGYVSKGQMPAEMDAAAFSLKEGSFSDVIQSPFGFHLLFLTEVKITALADASAEIRERLDANRFDSQIEAKIKAAGVKIDESFFQH